MLDSFNISSSLGKYEIIITNNYINKIISEYPDAIYFIDDNLLDYFPQKPKHMLLVHAIENNKSLEKISEYIGGLKDLGGNRQSQLIAIGGGITQDIATFVASVYMRGIPWTYFPSTVLAMADSCIGGKSSINVAGYKNLIGNFYPPDKIIIDSEFIKTLDDDMIIGGFFEAAKIAYARSFDDFKKYASLAPNVNAAKQNIEAIIKHSLTTKKWFIEIDEFDKKERLLLNFGHTFGHALEASTNFDIHHGVGVGLGMLVAAELAKDQNLLNSDGLDRTKLLVDHVIAMLKSSNGPRTWSTPRILLSDLIKKFEFDKKHNNDQYRVVIPVRSGELELVSMPRNSVSCSQFENSFTQALSALNFKIDI